MKMISTALSKGGGTPEILTPNLMATNFNGNIIFKLQYKNFEK
jgi:hypothetical protein